jgi:hypothetical protein
MDGSWLKAIEFFGFMGLAVWLVYYQYVSSRRDRDRSGQTESRSHDSDAGKDETPPS